jgi:hypothetical protein
MSADTAPADEFKKIPATAGSEDISMSGDAAGQREAAAVEAGTLEEQSKVLTQTLRQHINAAIVFLIWLSFVLISVALIIAAVHHLSPWGWLTEIQLAVLDTFLFSGALVSAAGRYIVTRIF